MALPSHKLQPVGDESLEKWSQSIGSGGFGRVYRVRHKGLGDVAIKILDTGVGYKEATLMETVSCEFVLTVHGIYKGYPPTSRGSMKHGIVMEFMRRGSVDSLLNVLSGPPPWPLVFRLAHQVALGVNFLHLKEIVHQDLKPSNVLLTDDLNARIADFGLSRVSTSALTSSSEQTGETGGTWKYMPPEAFTDSYKPVRAFDIYSYGILLWSIVTGKEPYPGRTNLVALRIPSGDRPDCEDLDQVKGKVEGLKELVDLMKRCWVKDPDNRPKIYDEERPNDSEVLKEIKELFSKHKKDIHVAVFEVIQRLDSPNANQRSETSVSNRRPPPQAPERSMSNDERDMPSPITRTPPTQDLPNTNQRSETSVSNRRPPPQAPERSMSNDEVDMPSPITRTPPTQDASRSSAKHMTDEEKEKFVNDKRATLIQEVKVVERIAEELGDMVNQEAYDKIAAEKLSQDQMRVLYRDVLHSGGMTVKAAFYDALKRNYPPLVKKHGGF